MSFHLNRLNMFSFDVDKVHHVAVWNDARLVPEVAEGFCSHCKGRLIKQECRCGYCFACDGYWYMRDAGLVIFRSPIEEHIHGEPVV